MAKRRYKNIMVFKDGLPGWIKAGYPVKSLMAADNTKIPSVSAEQLSEMLGNVYVIDVRPENLYELGFLPYSRAIPLGHLSRLYTEIPKKIKIVVVDHKEKQAPTACKFLRSKGYNNVSWLKGGLASWSKQGLELEK